MSTASAATIVPAHHEDKTGAKISMWLFLFGELLIFGGVFLLYAAYLYKYGSDFHNAASELNALLGAINTLVLLTSSLTVALSIAALERGNKRLAVYCLIFTILCGGVFMVNKYFEWSAKIEHGLYPGSEEMESLAPGENVFYGLYYAATGLHGLHVVAGAGLLSFVLIRILRNPYKTIHFAPHELHPVGKTQLCLVGPQGQKVWQGEPVDDSVRSISIQISYDDHRADKINPHDKILLENAGLFWHLVDIVWIFLFPLFYLIT